MIKSIIIAVVVALLAPYGARAQGVPELECSCSPKTFQFIISLDISLDPFCTQKNDIVSNTGILDATTRCSFAVVRVIPESISEGDGIKEEESIMFEELQPDFAVQNITSIEFKESNEDGDVIRITTLNYGTPLPLEDGDKVDLVSVSSALDPSLSLEDQMGKVPYSVEIRLYGYNAEDELIINIIRWTYDLSCGSDPIQTGDTIGWITIDKLEGPWPQFCPTVPSPSPSASMSYGSYNKRSKAAKAKAHNSKKGGRKTQQNTA